MLSFVPGRVDDREIDAGQEDVWILYRTNSQSCLIIGVFASPKAAFHYVEQNGPADRPAWTEPHRGQRYWQFQSELFTYLIEPHRVRRERNIDRHAALYPGHSAN